MFKILDRRDAYLLLDMCIDAEERCNQRIQEARDKGESSVALFLVHQKEKYEVLKRKIVAEIQGDRSSLNEDSDVFAERVRKIRDSRSGS
jgi:hypothetical protein